MGKSWRTQREIENANSTHSFIHWKCDDSWKLIKTEKIQIFWKSSKLETLVVWVWFSWLHHHGDSSWLDPGSAHTLNAEKAALPSTGSGKNRRKMQENSGRNDVRAPDRTGRPFKKTGELPQEWRQRSGAADTPAVRPAWAKFWAFVASI